MSARKVLQIGLRQALGLETREAVFETTTMRAVPLVVVQLVGAVRHLVQHRLRVRPYPGKRPQEPAEHQRQQAQRADRLELRMVALVGDLLRQDVDQPEENNQRRRDDEDDEERQDRWRPCLRVRAITGWL